MNKDLAAKVADAKFPGTATNNMKHLSFKSVSHPNAEADTTLSLGLITLIRTKMPKIAVGLKLLRFCTIFYCAYIQEYMVY